MRKRGVRSLEESIRWTQRNIDSQLARPIARYDRRVHLDADDVLAIIEAAQQVTHD